MMSPMHSIPLAIDIFCYILYFDTILYSRIISKITMFSSHE